MADFFIQEYNNIFVKKYSLYLIIKGFRKFNISHFL